MSRARTIADFGDGIATADIDDGAVTAGKLDIGQIGGRRNLIINGAMRIDQRNSGATVTAHNSYPVDRFRVSEVTTSGTFETSRSTDSPDGFDHSLLFKVKTVDSDISATEYAGIRTKIEGHDISHLNFGSSAAQTITLSFWCKFSVTGTYGGAIGNGSDTTYPFSYTINSADTWERKTITITGAQTGTFATDNSIGFELWILSIAGSNFGNESAGAWVSSYEIAPTGVTNFYATDESTYYITGVQLEVGTVATPFEHRSYGEELALCQRYYWRKDGSTGSWAHATQRSTTQSEVGVQHPVQMRANPTLGSSGTWTVGFWGSSSTVSDFTFNVNGTVISDVQITHGSGGAAGRAIEFFAASGAYIDFDAEL